MTARCPFCEAIHPVRAPCSATQIDCPCGATALLCAPNTEPETAIHLVEMGLWDTLADVLDGSLSIVWGKPSSRRKPYAL